MLLSKILQDSDLGEPLKNVIIRTIVPLGKMLRDSDPDEPSEKLFGSACTMVIPEIQGNCLVVLKMITLHNFQTCIKCWTLLEIQCDS